MIRKASIIGTLALGLAVTAASPVKMSHFVSSAHSFRHYFKDLKDTGNPIQRFFFSLVLANTPQNHT